MRSQQIIKRVLLGVALCFGGLTAWGQDRVENLPESTGSTSQSLNERDNPFLALSHDVSAGPQGAMEFGRSASTAMGKPGNQEIFLETLDLEYLNARQASEAYAYLAAKGGGKIVVQETSNSLIIFATKENLAQIVAALKKADRPINALTITSVPLRYIDVQTAAKIIAPFASGQGSITEVKPSNSLVLCDSKSRVDRMLSELEKLDVRESGFVVDQIPLKYIDAKSVSEALAPLKSPEGVITVATSNNAVLVSDFQQNIDRIREKVVALDIPTGTLQMRTINLKYLQAKNLEPVIAKMVSENGSVGVNEESNSIMVCDTSERLKLIIQEINVADRAPQQILVEVVLMDVRLDNDMEIGVNWDMLTDGISDVTYRQNMTTNRVSSTILSSDTLGDATAYNSTGVLGGDLAIVSDTVRAVIHLIQEKREVEIIASPQTMVRSGSSSTIKAVEEIPYVEQSQTGEGGDMTSTEFKEVGVTLEVTAILTEDDRISLELQVEQNVKSGESTQGVPIVDTRNQQTTLSLSDGQVVVMGGLRRSENTETVDRVPLISELPLVGVLFKNTTTEVSNSELVVLVSPHIYRDETVPDSVAKRYESFDGEFNLSKMSPEELAALAGPVGNDINH